MMAAVLIYAFAAAVLGGIDSPLGAVVGGLLLGVLLNLLSYLSQYGAFDWFTEELRLPMALLDHPRRAPRAAAGDLRPAGGEARMKPRTQRIVGFVALRGVRRLRRRAAVVRQRLQGARVLVRRRST